jgi:hypothetical protein
MEARRDVPLCVCTSLLIYGHGGMEVAVLRVGPTGTSREIYHGVAHCWLASIRHQHLNYFKFLHIDGYMAPDHVYGVQRSARGFCPWSQNAFLCILRSVSTGIFVTSAKSRLIGGVKNILHTAMISSWLNFNADMRRTWACTYLKYTFMVKGPGSRQSLNMYRSTHPIME